MYINGKEVARDTKVSLAKSWANQKGQLIYNATGNGAMMCNANFGSFWVWNNRVLTAQEAAEMYANPWGMFAPGPAPDWGRVVARRGRGGRGGRFGYRGSGIEIRGCLAPAARRDSGGGYGAWGFGVWRSAIVNPGV